MAGKSLFDLGGGKITAEPGTATNPGGTEGTSRRVDSAPKPASDGPALSATDAFGPSAGDAIPDVDPEAPFGRFEDGTPRKRRARGTGTGTSSGPRKSASETKGDVSGIESLLISIHLMGAVALKQPGLALNEVEAKRLAVAVQQVQAQYPFVIDAKTQAWINLAAIGGMIYVPRFMAVAGASKAARKSKGANQPSQSEGAVPTPAEVMAASPSVAPNHKGPLTPAQLFGPLGAGG